MDYLLEEEISIIEIKICMHQDQNKKELTRY